MYDYLKGKEAKQLSDDFVKVPDGIYKVFVENIAKYTTQNGENGIKTVLSVVEGDQKDQKIWYRIILPNDSEEQANPKRFTFLLNKILDYAYWMEGEGGDPNKAINPNSWNSYLDKVFMVQLKSRTVGDKEYQDMKFLVSHGKMAQANVTFDDDIEFTPEESMTPPDPFEEGNNNNNGW